MYIEYCIDCLSNKERTWLSLCALSKSTCKNHNFILTQWYFNWLHLLHDNNGLTWRQSLHSKQADLVLCIWRKASDHRWGLSRAQIQLLPLAAGNHGNHLQLVSGNVPDGGVPGHPHGLWGHLQDLEVIGWLNNCKYLSQNPNYRIIWNSMCHEWTQICLNGVSAKRNFLLHALKTDNQIKKNISVTVNS